MSKLVQHQHQPANETVVQSLLNLKSSPVKGPQSNVNHSKMELKLKR